MSRTDVIDGPARIHRRRSLMLAGLVALAFAMLSFGHVSGALAVPPAGGGAGSGGGCPIGPEGSTTTAPPGTIYVFDSSLTVICGSDGHWHRVCQVVKVSGPVSVVTAPVAVRPPLAIAK